MQSTIRQLRIEFLEAQIEANRFYCDSLAQKFKTTLNIDQQAELARRCADAMKDRQSLQRLLDQLEQSERERASDA